MSNKFYCATDEVIQAHLHSLAAADIAEALSIDSSAVSRLKSGERGLREGEVGRLMGLQSKAYPDGLQIAPASAMVVSREELTAIHSLAKKYLETITI